jgi:hypothetical protein
MLLFWIFQNFPQKDVYLSKMIHHKKSVDHTSNWERGVLDYGTV